MIKTRDWKALLTKWREQRYLMEFALSCDEHEDFNESRVWTDPNGTLEVAEYHQLRSGRTLNALLAEMGLQIPHTGNEEIPQLEDVTLAEYAKGEITEGHGMNLIAGGDRLRFREKFQYWLTMHPDATY